MYEERRTIHHFTHLDAWQRNHELVIEIYKITKDFPKHERFGLTIQLRKAISSVTANIAEGYGRFHYRDKIRFYISSSGF